MDFTEIMNFCGYDMEKADRMVKEYIDAVEEALTDAGLEALEPESLSQECRRLCGPGRVCRSGPDVVSGV